MVQKDQIPKPIICTKWTKNVRHVAGSGAKKVRWRVKYIGQIHCGKVSEKKFFGGRMWVRNIDT